MWDGYLKPENDSIEIEDAALETEEDLERYIEHERQEFLDEWFDYLGEFYD